jgi:hypothetical protein
MIAHDLNLQGYKENKVGLKRGGLPKAQTNQHHGN